MRKIITCMILGLLSLVSCTEYDEVAMWNKNEDMGSRLAALEEPSTPCTEPSRPSMTIVRPTS